MAINYATKFEKKVDERFKMKSLSQAFTNTDYEWTGVSTIKVYSVNTVAMSDYSLTGSTRYGVASELENEVQEMLLAKDRAFTFTIDSKSNDDTNGVMAAGKALARQIDEIVVPEIDTYVFRKMVLAAIANSKTKTTAVSDTNAYSVFLDAQASLDDDLVPVDGRIMGCSPTYYKFLKLDDSFMLASDIAMTKKINGQLGECDGVAIVKIPSSRLTNNVSFILAHPVATVQANKLKSYILHKNPVGINGDVVEGRIRYDAFVLNQKVDAIYVHATALLS